MKYAKISFLLYLNTFVFLSCSQQKTESILLNQISIDSQKTFRLDSLTTFELIQHQIVKTDSVSYLATLDLAFNYINLFHWERGDILKKIKLNIGDGPDQIVTPVNFYIHNLDSIFVQDSRVGIKLMNHEGVYQTFKVGEVKIKTNEYKGIPAYFYANSSRPIFFYKDQIVYPTTHVDIKKPVIAFYDLLKNELDEYINFPLDGFENEDYLYENIYRSVYWDWSLNEDFLFVSFPIKNQLYKFDLKTKKTHQMSLTPIPKVNFSGHFNSLFSDIRQLGTTDEELKEAKRRVDIFEKNKSFSSIFACDSIIYRVLIHEKKESNANSFNIDFRDFEIFAYDYNGKLIANNMFKNPQDDGSVFLINRTENFILKYENSLYISTLKVDQSEDELIYKKLTLK